MSRHLFSVLADLIIIIGLFGTIYISLVTFQDLVPTRSHNRSGEISATNTTKYDY